MIPRPLRATTALLAATILSMTLAASPGLADDDDATEPVINEFVFNHFGSDRFEFIEILGDEETDYSAFTVVVIEGDSFDPGLIDQLFRVGATNEDGLKFTAFLSNRLENGTQTLLLVKNFDFTVATLGTDLDTDNDGTLDSTPWTSIVDGVAVSDGGLSDKTYTSVVLFGGFDSNFMNVGGASRIPDGIDTDSDFDWVRNDFAGDGLPGISSPVAASDVQNTPGALNDDDDDDDDDSDSD